MLKKLFPKQPNFFHSLANLADIAAETSNEFEKFLTTPEKVEQIATRIATLEDNADKLVRSSITTLGETFITPIEREHLHSLYVMIDEVIDLTYACSDRILVYKMQTFTAKTQEMIKLTTTCVKLLQDLVHNLDEMREPEQLHAQINEIHTVESKIDSAMRQSLGSLYDSSLPISQILKERDLILVIERISDAAEEVAHLIEAIIIDQS